MALDRTSAVGTTLEIMLNGQRREVPEPMTVAQLLGHLGLKPEHVAVEVNRDLVSRVPARGDSARARRRPGDCHARRRWVGNSQRGRGPAAPDRHAQRPQPALRRDRKVHDPRADARLSGGQRCRGGHGCGSPGAAVRSPGPEPARLSRPAAVHDPAQHGRLLLRRGGAPDRPAGPRAAGGPGKSRGRLGQARGPGRHPDPLARPGRDARGDPGSGRTRASRSSATPATIPIMARRLKEAGATSVMPAGSPIGSGQGVLNPNNIRIILEDLKADDPSLSRDRGRGRRHGQRCGDRHGTGLRRRLAQHRESPAPPIRCAWPAPCGWRSRPAGWPRARGGSRGSSMPRPPAPRRGWWVETERACGRFSPSPRAATAWHNWTPLRSLDPAAPWLAGCLPTRSATSNSRWPRPWPGPSNVPVT